jgi:CubicO group peptidase (beta-lactamase class C family)
LDVLCGDLLRPAAMTSTRPAGGDGVTSSVRDLIGYAERVLAGERPGAVLTPQRSRGTDRQHAGLGWNLDQAGPDLVAWQCGRAGRYRARITVVPSRRLAYVVLTNAPHGEVVRRHLSDELLWTVTGGAGPADLPRRYEADVEDFTGVFNAGAGGLVTLRPGLLPGELGLDVDRGARPAGTEEAGWEPVPADRVVPFSAQELLVLGPAAMHGTFIGLARSDAGRVTGLRIGGRLAPRVGLVPVS